MPCEQHSLDPKRKKVTLAWDGDDVAEAIGTMFHSGDKAKYIDLPLSNYSTWPNDRIMLDGEMVGVSTFSGYSANESSMLSLAVRRRRARRAGHRGDAHLGRGGRRLEEARGRAPRADRDPRDRLARPVRRGRPRLVPTGLAEHGRATPSWSACTGRSPGRSRCTSGASGACSTGPTAAPRRRRSGSAGSGSGTPTSSTCWRRAACARCGRSSTTTGCATSSSSS